MSRRIIRQDVNLIRALAGQKRRFANERFLRAETDLLGGHIRDLRHAAASGSPLPVIPESLVPIRF